jgi:hypothetical protein
VNFNNSNLVNPVGTTLNLNTTGGTVNVAPTNTVSTGGVFVRTGVNIRADGELAFALNGGTFSNGGDVRSSGPIEVTGVSTLLMNNAVLVGGQTGAGPLNIEGASGVSLLLNGNGTFGAGSGINISNFPGTAGSIVFGDGLASNTLVFISPSNVFVSANRGVAGVGAGTITIRDGMTVAASDLGGFTNINLQAASVTIGNTTSGPGPAQLTSTGGSVNIITSSLINNGQVRSTSAGINILPRSNDNLLSVSGNTGGDSSGSFGLFFAGGRINFLNNTLSTVNATLSFAPNSNLFLSAPDQVVLDVLTGGKTSASIVINSGVNLRTPVGAPATRWYFGATSVLNNGTVNNSSNSLVQFAGSDTPPTFFPFVMTGTGSIVSTNSNGTVRSGIIFQGSTVSVTQGTLNGNVYGNSYGSASGSNFNLTVTSGNVFLLGPTVLTELNGITTVNGNISVATLSGDINVNGSSALSPGGFQPLLIAGVGNNPAIYFQSALLNPSQLTNNGSLTLTASGNVVLNPASSNVGPALASTAADLSIISTTGGITMNAPGTTNTVLVAAGGNILINSVTPNSNIFVDGVTFRAIGRYLPGNQKVKIDGQMLPAYSGGSIGIVAGPPPAGGLSAYLQNVQSNRVAKGTVVDPSGSLNKDKTVVKGGGSVEVIDGTITAPEVTFTVNGGVIYLDPLTIGPGTSFFSVSPALVLPDPTNPTATVTAPTIALSAQPGITSSQSIFSRVPTDVTSVKAAKTDEHMLFQCALPGTLSGEIPVPEEAEVAWVITTDLCQPIVFEQQDGLIVFGTPGSVFEPKEDRTLLLKEGMILAVAGQNGLVVQSPHGKVKIPPGSPVAVEQVSGEQLKFNSLAGAEVNITLEDGSGKTFSAEPGEDIVISETGDLSKSEPSESAGTPGVKTTVRSMGRQKNSMLQRLANCNLTCFPQIMRMRIQKLIDDAQARLEQQSNPSDPPNTSELPDTDAKPVIISASPMIEIDMRPVAFNTKSPKPSGTEMQTVQTSTATIKALMLGARAEAASGGVINLLDGQILLSTREKTLVKAGNYTIVLDPEVLVLITKTQDTVRLGALWSSRVNSVRAQFKDKYVNLVEGQELVMSNSADMIIEQLKSDKLSRRNIRGFKLPDGSQISCAEFSFISMIQSNDLLTRITKSHDVADKQIADKVMKMAACISYVTRSRGNFMMLSLNK